MPKSPALSQEEFVYICEQRTLYTETILDNLIHDHPKRHRLIDKLGEWRDLSYDLYNSAAPRQIQQSTAHPAFAAETETPSRSWEFTKI